MQVIKTFSDFSKKLLFVLDKKQKLYGLLVAVCSFIGALLEVVGVGIILPLVSAFINADALMTHKWLQLPIAIFKIEDSRQLIVLITVGVICVFILKNAYFIFLSWLRMKYSCKVSRELSSLMMSTYMKRGYEFFLSQNTSDLSRNINADVSGVNTILYQFLRVFIDALTICLIVIVILITDAGMAVAMALLAVICLIFIYTFFRKQMRNAGILFSKYNGMTGKYLLQALHGIKEILVVQKQNYFVKHFEEANAQKQNASIKQTVGAEAPAYLIEGICVAGLMVVVCVRVASGEQNAMDLIPALSAFAVGAFRILPSLGRISSAVNTLLYYLPSLDHVYENMKNFSDGEKRRCAAIGVNVDTNPISEFTDSIAIEDICWNYKNSDKEVLSKLNMVIKKGQSVAFIGQSGAGKTTLADIILGLFPPREGRVLIDGRDTAEVNYDLSRIMGYVPQSVYLTDDTIRNNIAFGEEERDIDDTKVWEALEKAQLKQFVEELQDGLDTIVGDRGVRFSGGQRQRVAIARALYSNPAILIFDEATASLDTETETAVMDAIHALHGEKTIIIIAHRLTTIQECDVIFRIENGVAVSVSHEEIYEEKKGN